MEDSWKISPSGLAKEAYPSFSIDLVSRFAFEFPQVGRVSLCI